MDNVVLESATPSQVPESIACAVVEGRILGPRCRSLACSLGQVQASESVGVLSTAERVQHLTLQCYAPKPSVSRKKCFVLFFF